MNCSLMWIFARERIFIKNHFLCSIKESKRSQKCLWCKINILKSFSIDYNWFKPKLTLQKYFLQKKKGTPPLYRYRYNGMKQALCFEIFIKFPLKLFLFHVILFCFYFNTTENSQFFEIWRSHSSIRLISTVVTWNVTFWQSCIFKIKKLDNSRNILEENIKIPIKVAIFDLLQMISRIGKITEYSHQQSMRNIKISLEQKGATIKFTFLIKELGSNTNIFDRTIFDKFIYLKWLNFLPESKCLACNDDWK